MKEIDYRGCRAVVLGWGITGRAVRDFLEQRGANVVVYDDRVPKEMFEGEVLSTDLDQFESDVRSSDLVVVSPGVPLHHKVFQFAHRPISELELAFRHTEKPIIAVTGTNGKTTTVTLIAEILRVAGFSSLAVGNIGTSFISNLAQEPDYYVVEASSFQLATTYEFRPNVGLWTNFSPDHLDWHGDINHYFCSKKKLFANQVNGDFAIINAGDFRLKDVTVNAEVSRIDFGLGDYQFGLNSDRSSLIGNGELIVSINDLPRSLPHDLENDLASAATASCLGVPNWAVSQTLLKFKGLAHRVEFVQTIDGTAFYNDSKATTPASVVAAVNGFESVVLIAGGRNKGLDLSPLLEIVHKVKALVLIGESADEMKELFGSVCAIEMVEAKSMKDAVVLAKGLATEQATVLLSPGCTSYDWYGSYIQRGEDFKQRVQELASDWRGE